MNMPPSAASSESKAPLWRGIAVTVRVLRALIIREMLMRFGRDGAGFLWVIIEPMLLTAGVMGMWSLLEPSGKHGFRIVEFVITGYMPLTLWRHLTNPMAQIFRRSVSLRYHRHITLYDIMFARQIQEFLGTTIALLVVFFTMYSLGVVEAPVDLSLVGAGWMLMGGLSVGGGMLIAALTEAEEASDRFIGPFQYILVPISGGFFMVDWMPQEYHHIILLNPLTSCFEVFRHGYFGDAGVFHYSMAYVGLWILVLLLLGLTIVNRIKDRIQIS